MSATAKINKTKNYSMFQISIENRPLDITKHKRLKESMLKYGFLQSFPISCYRDDKGNLIVKDGQHRLAIAQELGLVVHWIEDTQDFCVAEVNSTSKAWCIDDYARRFAADGNFNYQIALEFAEKTKIPISLAAGFLAGHCGSSNVMKDMKDGTFRIKDQEYAYNVADLYKGLLSLAPNIRHNNLILACAAVVRVKNFDQKRMLQNAARCREKLIKYSQREAFLQMLEDIYNFGRSILVPLKIEAIEVMKNRNATTVAAKKKKLKNIDTDS